eukprot:13952487-Alexandrium_andersonii.AAC.1
MRLQRHGGPSNSCALPPRSARALGRQLRPRRQHAVVGKNRARDLIAQLSRVLAILGCRELPLGGERKPPRLARVGSVAQAAQTPQRWAPVSYTHLTLPTICSV